MQPTADDLASIARISAGLKEVVALSAAIGNWAFVLLGGTLAMLLSTSYHKPGPRMRLFFVLVPVAIGFLALSLERGAHIHRAYAALLLRQPTIEAANEALVAVNSGLIGQLQFFGYALWALGIWFIGYTIWWIFIERPRNQGDVENGT